MSITWVPSDASERQRETPPSRCFAASCPEPFEPCEPFKASEPRWGSSENLFEQMPAFWVVFFWEDVLYTKKMQFGSVGGICEM